MKLHQTTAAARELFRRGAITLAEIEHNGVRVDRPYLEGAISTTQQAIDDMQRQLREDKQVYPEWRQRFGRKMKMGSRDQLATVLFDILGQKSKGETKTGRRRTDKEALELVDLSFVRTFVKCEEYKKALSTYLIGLQRELVKHADGCWYVHPSFNLNTVISYRSSANLPNFQNQPARNPEIAAMIRQCYIPRKGHHFCEVDYGQIEVGVPAAITGDKELRRYFCDPKADMHLDQACSVFMLPAAEIQRKTARATTKNNFVFASFYGAAAANCARRIWEDIDRFDIKTVSGVPMKQHLRSKGIKSLGDYDLKAVPQKGTFVYHVKQCQEALWQRFHGYAEWKERIYRQYLRDGGMTFVTGFAFNGIGPKNEVTNYPIQGPAFHCTLWSLNRLVPLMKKYKFKTCIVGEIHDSIQPDTHPKELNDVLDLCRQVMTKDIAKAWDWITVPLKVEAEVAPLNKAWLFKKEWVETNGVWALKV